MKLNGLIFDLDGTLIDSVPTFTTAYLVALEKNGYPHVTRDVLNATLGPNEVGVFKRIAPDRWESCLSDFYQFEKEQAKSITPFEGIIELLEYSSKNGIHLGIVTGRARKHAELFLRLHRIFKYFKPILFGSSTEDAKPKNIVHVLHTWCLEAQTIAYIGDTITDITAARIAGIEPILARWGTQPPETEISKKELLPRLLFDSPYDLIEWIRNNS